MTTKYIECFKKIILFFIHISGFGLAQTSQHGAVDALHPNVQTPPLPMGPAGGPLGQLQDGPDGGHHHEEVVSAGGAMLSKAGGGRRERQRTDAQGQSRAVRPKVPRGAHVGGRR